MSETIESTGRTVEEAISEALLQLGARREEVEVEVVEEGKSGFLGVFGNRPARVIVTRKASGHGRQRRPRGRNNGQRRSGRQPAAVPGEPKEKARASASGRGSSGQNQERRSSSRPVAAKASGRSADRDSAAGKRDANKRRGRATTTAARQDRQPPVSEREVQAVPVGDEIRATTLADPVRGVPIQDAPQSLERITSQLMTLAGFPCRCEVQEGEYHLVKIITDDSSAGVLIGRHGSTVDAIEHLVERMASQAAGERVNLNLDVNNYRRRREENLVLRAQELAQKVASTGKEIHMEPLCARERRIVHLEVVNVPGLRTYTVANNVGKHVVIAKGEDEGAQDADSAPALEDESNQA